MKNIALICSSDYMAIPAALKLIDAGILSCIIIPRKYKSRLLPSFLQSGISEDIIETVTKETLESKVISTIQQRNADCIFVITFPWKLPDAVLNAVPLGGVNFHPGLLPKYRGQDPIFWQIRNRETNGGFVVHKMTDKYDDGTILHTQTMPIMPGETYGIHHSRLGVLAAEIVLKVCEAVNDSTPTEHIQSIEEDHFFKKPGKQDITINWTQQSSEEIEALVNATNPKYNGALTRIRNMELTILEVAFADLKDAPKDVQAGTVVYADTIHGPVVVCADGKFLKMSHVCMPEGYISGCKLVSMGCATGDRFI